MDREPQPSDGPEYHSHHAAWEVRQRSKPVPDVQGNDLGRWSSHVERNHGINPHPTTTAAPIPIPPWRPSPTIVPNQPYVAPPIIIPKYPPYIGRPIVVGVPTAYERIAAALERIANALEKPTTKWRDARD